MKARSDIDWQDPTYEAAAEWVVRLHGSVSEAKAEADWLAFEAWLDAAPAHRDAFDAAEALWSELGRDSRAITKALDQPQGATIFAFPTRPQRAGPVWWAATAAAAASILLLVGPFSPLRSTPPSVYTTAKGQQRLVNLADGSKILLNSGSQLSILFDGRRREATLAEGSEAAFTIVHDPSRPFVVRVGDRTVRDLGTEFDVLRNNGALQVTVRSGSVEVTPADGAVGKVIALAPGRQLNHREGKADGEVTAVAADDVFAWRTGRLIYRDRPLAEVADDISRYYATPVRVDGQAASLRFSGVLAITDEPAVINRLAALVPVSANSRDGVIVLQGRTVSR